MKLTLRQVEIFLAVAEHEHFGRGAARLQIAQPTASKEVRALERALGVELFERRGRGTRLTAEGSALRKSAEELLGAARDFTVAADRLHQRGAGTLSLAVSPSIVNRLSPQILQRMEETHPEMSVAVLDVETGEVESAVADGSADLGLGHALRETAGCERRRLGQSSLVLYAAQNLADLIADPDDLRALAETPLLLWPRENNPDYFDKIMAVCRSRGLDPLLIIGGSRLSGSRGYLLDQGRAFSVIPSDFAWAHPGKHVVIPLREDARISLDAMWRDPPSRPVRLALEAAYELVRERSST